MCAVENTKVEHYDLYGFFLKHKTRSLRVPYMPYDYKMHCFVCQKNRKG